MMFYKDEYQGFILNKKRNYAAPIKQTEVMMMKLFKIWNLIAEKP